MTQSELIAAIHAGEKDLQGFNLRYDNLAGADLTRANLTNADLTRANLTDADLRFADLTGANLRGADLRFAYLTGANLRDADLTYANLTNADLTGANLTDANLTGANLTDAYLDAIRADVYRVLENARDEVPALLAALREGRIDGSVYEGACACLVGTIAKTRGVDYRTLSHDSHSPAERWFLAIRIGDTPETSQIAKITEEWISTFQASLSNV